MQRERDLATPPEAGARTWAWILLYGALAASAGQGLFLATVLTRHHWMPNWAILLRVMGRLGTSAIVWFLAAIPLALIALLARRRLQHLTWLWPLSLAAAAASVAAFVLYGMRMAA